MSDEEYQLRFPPQYTKNLPLLLSVYFTGLSCAATGKLHKTTIIADSSLNILLMKKFVQKYNKKLVNSELTSV